MQVRASKSLFFAISGKSNFGRQAIIKIVAHIQNEQKANQEVARVCCALDGDFRTLFFKLCGILRLLRKMLKFSRSLAVHGSLTNTTSLSSNFFKSVII
jgi:hypothetical protein